MTLWSLARCKVWYLYNGREFSENWRATKYILCLRFWWTNYQPRTPYRSRDMICATLAHWPMYDVRWYVAAKIPLRCRVADLSEFGVFRADKKAIFNRRSSRWRWTKCRCVILPSSAAIWSRSRGLCQVISLQGRRLAPTSASDQGLQVAAIRTDKLSALRAF